MLFLTSLQSKLETFEITSSLAFFLKIEIFFQTCKIPTTAEIATENVSKSKIFIYQYTKNGLRGQNIFLFQIKLINQWIIRKKLIFDQNYTKNYILAMIRVEIGQGNLKKPGKWLWHWKSQGGFKKKSGKIRESQGKSFNQGKFFNLF